MTDHPIIFTGPMVRAILEGRKTQTRRIIKPQPIWDSEWGGNGEWIYTNRYGYEFPLSEYASNYSKGDMLWVKEAWSHGWPMNAGDVLPPEPAEGAVAITYRETGKVPFGSHGRWRSPIFMPRWASRITLKVTDVRVQRLQDISERDAEAEGVAPLYAQGWPSREHIGGFRKAWCLIHSIGSWEENPWVAAISFERVQP